MGKLTIVLVLLITSIGLFRFEGIAAAANVVLKMQVKNPSKTETQNVPVKVYLPREVNPKDIIDLGDLELDYDPDTGMYFVHSSVELGPGQSMTKGVEMKDVWVFTEEQLASFVNEAKEMASQLEGTPYAADAAALMIGIQEKVEGILRRQEETADNPNERIPAYRQGLSVIAAIEQDVSALDRLRLEGGQGKDLPVKDSGPGDSRIALLGSGGVPEGGAPLGRSISMSTAWRIIFAILAFLGVLSVIFFMTWHRLLKGTMEAEQEAAPLSPGLQEEKGTENEPAGPQPE